MQSQAQKLYFQKIFVLILKLLDLAIHARVKMQLDFVATKQVFPIAKLETILCMHAYKHCFVLTYLLNFCTAIQCKWLSAYTFC